MPNKSSNFVFSIEHHIYTKSEKMTSKKLCYMISGIAASWCIALCLCSCGMESGEMAERVAVGFAQNYYNLRFKQAARLCTDESLKWIQYQASNISADDLDVINSQTDTAQCEVEDISISDDHATVKMNIRNFLQCDSIGTAGRMCQQASCNIDLKKKGDQWLVDLKAPLVSVKEKQ